MENSIRKCNVSLSKIIKTIKFNTIWEISFKIWDNSFVAFPNFILLKQLILIKMFFSIIVNYFNTFTE